MKSNKLFIGVVLAVLMLSLLSCSLLYQIKAADSLVKKALADQEDVGKTLEKAESFSAEVDSLQPTEDNASTIISKSSALKENAKSSSDDLDDAKKKLKAAKNLRLPDWYKKGYIGKLEEAIKEKEDGLEEMEKMLSKTEKYGKSIQAWYKGNHNLKQAEVNIMNFGSSFGAKDFGTAANEAEKARTSITNAQTEFNNAASYVNIKIYSDARDAAGIYAQMIDPLQQIVTITDQIVNTPVQNLTLEMLNSASAQIDSLYAQLVQAGEKGDAIFPDDVPDDGSIPQSGQDQLSEWRKEDVETHVSKIKDNIKKAEELEDEAKDTRSEQN